MRPRPACQTTDVLYMFSLRFRQASRPVSGLSALVPIPSGIAHFVLGNRTRDQRFLVEGA